MDAARAKEIAIEEGFDAAGIASLGPSATAGAFERWLARGGHAGMGWIERRMELRRDPRGILEGARSALAVAWRYAPVAAADGDGEAERGDLWSGVARYARGSDYHDHLLSRLERVGERLASESPGLRWRAYVDTGPILERELAARAGLGAIGKNTNLLSPELGSWFLLGELLLSVDLAADLPITDLCGECTRCLEACPTGALPAPYQLDAGRCISYWTIEHRGAIPEPMRAGIGTWVFGCDVCQEVCPWNSRPRPLERRSELEPAPAARSLDLVALLGLDDAALRARFRGSPLLRPKPEGLRRNAAVALGNRRRPGDAAALAAALASDPSPRVRGHAAWALGRIGGPEADAALVRAEAEETDPGVRAEIAAARTGGLTKSNDPA